MKKLFLTMLMFLVLSGVAFADATVTFVTTDISDVKGELFAMTITATYDGTTATTLISTSTAGIKRSPVGWFLQSVRAYPVSGGTAPDAADVTVKYASAGSLDLLNTNGTNLIHATAEKITYPEMQDNVPSLLLITEAITLATANQATAGADYAVVMTFIKNSN